MSSDQIDQILIKKLLQTLFSSLFVSVKPTIFSKLNRVVLMPNPNLNPKNSVSLKVKIPNFYPYTGYISNRLKGSRVQDSFSQYILM